MLRVEDPGWPRKSSGNNLAAEDKNVLKVDFSLHKGEAVAIAA